MPPPRPSLSLAPGVRIEVLLGDQGTRSPSGRMASVSSYHPRPPSTSPGPIRYGAKLPAVDVAGLLGLMSPAMPRVPNEQILRALHTLSPAPMATALDRRAALVRSFARDPASYLRWLESQAPIGAVPVLFPPQLIFPFTCAFQERWRLSG